jgi:hypothetical protein
MIYLGRLTCHPIPELAPVIMITLLLWMSDSVIVGYLRVETEWLSANIAFMDIGRFVMADFYVTYWFPTGETIRGKK